MIRRACGVALLLATSRVAADAQQQNASRPTPCDLIPQPTTRLSFDSLPGVGAVSFIGGGVIFKCPQRGITLRGDSAERYPDRQVIVGNAVYDEPRVHLTADFLNYFQADERVVAAGNVHATLPTGSRLDGPQAEWKRAVPRVRTRDEMNAIGRPTITIVEKDSTGKPAEPTVVVANTVHMVGDSASLIYGGGQVVITRPGIRATGDSAFIDEEKETMQLMHNPQLSGTGVRRFTLRGDLIDLFSHNRKVERVIARANATAISDSTTLKADTIDLRVQNDLLDHAYAWGRKSRATAVSPSERLTADSLDVFMPDQHMRLVRAVSQALAQGKPDTAHFRVDKPDTTDWIKGDTIIAHFDSVPARDTSHTPPIRQLVATGDASSVYHLAPSDTSMHRPAINYVTARVITIDFENQRPSTVTTVDSVAGVYLEPQADSTARTGRGAGTKPGAVKPPVRSVVPLPKRPPHASQTPSDFLDS